MPLAWRGRFNRIARTENGEGRRGKSEREQEAEGGGAFHNRYTYLHQTCQSARVRIFLESELMVQPPTGNNASEQRGGKRIQKPPDSNEPMNANEHSGLDNDGQRHCAPNTNREENAAQKSRSEYRDVETHDERKEARDGDRGKDVEQTGERVTSGSLRSPGLRSFFLILMKDAAHQDPTGEDRDNSSDETGNECGAKRIHESKNMSILARAALDCRF